MRSANAWSSQPWVLAETRAARETFLPFTYLLFELWDQVTVFAAGIPAAAAGWHQLPPSLLKNGKKKKSFATVLIDKYPVNTFGVG